MFSNGGSLKPESTDSGTHDGLPWIFRLRKLPRMLGTTMAAAALAGALAGALSAGAAAHVTAAPSAQCGVYLHSSQCG
ncbi:MAG TPA: hypothetical protein VMU94_14135 [Streptosporangiaceae bacterium]|nr:hypothetical protein [Streptosporangiaceae bacterium]